MKENNRLTDTSILNILLPKKVHLITRIRDRDSLTQQIFISQSSFLYDKTNHLRTKWKFYIKHATAGFTKVSMLESGLHYNHLLRRYVQNHGKKYKEHILCHCDTRSLLSL